MKGLASFLTKGRLQAIVALTFFTFLSVLVPPLANLLSGAPLAFIALRQGLSIAIQVALGAFVVLSILLVIAGIQANSIALYTVAIWLPILIAAYVLRESQSQGWMLTIAGLLALIFVVYLHQQTNSVAADYREVFEAFWQKNILPNLTKTTPLDEINAMKQVMDNFVPFMSGMRACLIAVGIVSTVMFARWWQSKLYNPGGFKKEFIALQLPKWLLVPLAVSAGIVFMDGLVDDSIARDCLMVFMSLYIFQGMACIHAFVARKPTQQGWLIGMYLALIFVSLYAAIILACIGVADSVMGRKLPHDTV